MRNHRQYHIHRTPEPPAPAGQMLAPARQRAILDLLARQGGIRVARAAETFRVTQETIRRDLERLERDGLLVRSHGGAVPLDRDRTELPLDVRQTVHLTQKRAIAAYAVRKVAEGNVIALDASSTARELARFLPDIPLTIVTNSLAVAHVLHDRARVRVVVTGGILDGPSLSFVGEMAAEMLDRFHFTRAFISCQGIDLARGLSVTADEQAGIKRRMIALADEAVLLADSSKFGVKAVEFFAKITDIDTIITDTDLSRSHRRQLDNAGIRVDLARQDRSRG